MGRRLMVVAMVIVATACSASTMREWVAQLATPDTDHFARAVIDTLRDRPAQAVLPLLTPEAAMSTSIVDSVLSVKRQIPEGAIDSLEIVGARVNTWNGSTTREIDYQLHAGGQWAVIVIVIQEGLPEGLRVSGLRAQRFPESMQSTNALTLHHATPAALLAAVLALVAVGCSLYAAVQVVRSPLERRWLWVIVALLGFGKVSVAWNTGAMTEQWISVQLFGAGLVRYGMYTPWWISVSLPAGAFIALDRRRRALAARTHAMALAAEPPVTVEP